MSMMKRKLMLAGALTMCAFGGLALRLAWATPGNGITITPIAGPGMMDEVDTKSLSADHQARISTKGVSDVYVAHIRIVPGGHGGWHSHPGPSILAVESGTASIYHAHNPATPHVFPEGSAFVEDANSVHIVVNEGDTDLELVVLQIVPLGAPRRIDEPAP
jgi:quercetin dioxygenase-like cupin family protein